MSSASMDGPSTAQFVCCWIKDHYDAFVSLMSIVHREVDAGNPNVQQGDVMILARKAGISVTLTNQFRRDRNLWPGITRYMVMLSPRLSRALGFRESKLDGDDVDMIGTWYEIVKTYPLFYASSWREARELVEMDDITAQKNRRKVSA